jgi:putative sigma-54 modulation protein
MTEVHMSRKSKAAEFADTGYNISVTGRHVLVTDAMKDYALEKVSRIEKFTDRIIDVQIRMDIQRSEHRVDIVMSVGHLFIKSSAASSDMYVSIDNAIHKLETQLLKYKSRLSNHAGKHLSTVDMKVNVLNVPGEDLAEINDEIESENRRQLIDDYRHEIVKTETKPLKTLTLDEAIMKMDLSGETFLIFRSEEDRKLKVIYRREEGNFGVIEVES